MKYLNITKYLYLIIGIIMIIDAITKWNDKEKPWLSVILAGLAIFTFFFRDRFAKKFAERDKKNQSN
ncbi:hypothetical protein [Flavobacterium aciduliphilum]|uniref:Uncharacterized protein n=1 Tax=Flavobacterium aciduliphilum TaxID=1101402 RepID=A0A328YKN6_9FLAO|nr:hypothetical protein [Flavobacterium aciduliphilum]RAR74100.1 hypothetical protein CLV55_10228 [Flavobacterium aciduliphilum]